MPPGGGGGGGVSPLTNRPVPPNSNFRRALFTWVTASSGQDPLDTDNDQQDLIDFCGDEGINVLFLDIWVYLGGSNWTNSKRDDMMKFIEAAHKSGIRVYALAGNVDWGVNHQWVMKNIVEPVVAFNSIVVEGFDGFILDVEYWTDEQNYPASTNLPGLCDLVKAIKAATNLEVGLFSAFYLKDNSSTRANVSYNGKSAQDGEHMMDTADFVVVGAYRDHAEDGGSESGPGQITLFQPWYDYAKTVGKNFGLYCGSETINTSPSYVTYYGSSKSAMETEHTKISDEFKVATNAVFLGQAIHSYDGLKAMS